ncbi:MAG: HAD family hydrolase [Verrucomicrobiota bacterium]|jgi:2-phosphoglycolate phosphatase|nr:HAD family hydrolase [Verrucomicrobiota bacterium]
MSTETHRFKGYIFDLDGTLIDSFPAITESVNHVRTRHGLEPLSIAKVKTKVGHGLEYLLEKTVPDLDAISDQETYKTHHEKVILEKTVLLPFADEVLRQLHGEDKKIALASNKMRDFSNRILEHFGLLPLFDLVLGPESVPCRKPAPDMLEIALARWKLAPNDVLYVGDLNVDVETARAAGLPVCILLGEYPSRETLEAAAPDYLIESLRMLP